MPRKRIPADLRSLARGPTELCIKVLAGMLSQEAVPAAARVSAAGILLDRGWGKAPQSHVGEDGGDLRLVSGRLARAATRIDSLGDLNFMEEPLIVVWTIRRISSWIIGG